jgi:precorrin-8X/cobalt-precorrin-8 methylmutase
MGAGVRASAAGRQTLLARYGLPPAEIEARSLALVQKLAGAALPTDPAARKVATMMLYATGDPDLAGAIRFHPAAMASALAALRAGCSVVVDVRMVAAAVERERLRRLGCELICAIEEPEAAAAARERGTTQSAAAMQILTQRLDGAVVVVGNAPTALLALLDALDDGRARPALIIGTPVGLVAASEAKDELTRRSIPYITVLGTRGGSAIAAAALNALLKLATGG